MQRAGHLHEGHMAIPVTHSGYPSDGLIQDLSIALLQGCTKHPKGCGWQRCRRWTDENTEVFEIAMVVCVLRM